MYAFCNTVGIVLRQFLNYNTDMKNILNYAKVNNEKFSSKPFNDIDALILSWLAYYTFPDYLKGERRVALKDIKECGLLDDREMYGQAFNPKRSKKLFDILCGSQRFADIVLCDYREEKDEAREIQFAAVCMEIEKGINFLSFRGTDPSFIGWKENFNLACRFPVPSQLEAERYLRDEMQKHPDGKFYIGGHSKGGNLAVYAAVYADERMQAKITGVYNFEGPGYIYDIYSQAEYIKIADRVKKIIPRASFVGMVLEQRENLPVVKSKNISFLQHDPFSWTVKDDNFTYLKDRTKRSKKLERAFNGWINGLTLDERERAVSIIYNALLTLDASDFNEFFKTILKQLPAIYRAYKRLPLDDREFVKVNLKTLKRLIKPNKP